MGVLRMKPRPLLRIHRPLPDPPPDLGSQIWHLDGHPIQVILYSAEVWLRLQDPPSDALRFPGGVYGRIVVL
jgi:hypothetical protein